MSVVSESSLDKTGGSGVNAKSRVVTSEAGDSPILFDDVTLAEMVSPKVYNNGSASRTELKNVQVVSVLVSQGTSWYASVSFCST